MNTEYYWMYENYEEEYDEVSSLIRDKFWAQIRSGLYKKICKGSGGYNQWAYITGKKRFDGNNNKIFLFDKNRKILQQIIDFFNTTEGINELMNMGITEPPDHIDILIDYIQSAKTMQEIKLQEFRLYLKNRDKIWNYLTR